MAQLFGKEQKYKFCCVVAVCLNKRMGSTVKKMALWNERKSAFVLTGSAEEYVRDLDEAVNSE